MNCNLWVCEQDRNKQFLVLLCHLLESEPGLWEVVGGAHTANLKGMHPVRQADLQNKSAFLWRGMNQGKWSLYYSGLCRPPLTPIPELPQGIPTPNCFFLLSWWRRSKTGKEGRKAKPPLAAAALTEANTLEIKDVRDSSCFGSHSFSCPKACRF